ncbi:hypothetical protein OROHE_012847 [Orobanche hederae]
MTMETPPGIISCPFLESGVEKRSSTSEEDCSGIGQAQGRCHIQLSRLRRASRRFIWLLRLGRLIRATSPVMMMSGMTPLEHAAINGCCRVVALLFPVTSRIASFPDWSIKGVMEHVHSGEARVQVA